MSRVDDKQIGIARLYSRALLELAEKAGVAEAVLQELDDLVGLIEGDAEVERFFTSPLIDPEKREQSLETLFRGRMNDLLADTLQVMNRKGRLEVLAALAQLYREDYETRRGRVEVEATTAIELSETLRRKLRDELKRATGREIALVERVDPSLVGGLVVRIGDRKYDGSIRRRIEALRESFHQRARQEIYKLRLAEAAG